MFPFQSVNGIISRERQKMAEQNDAVKLAVLESNYVYIKEKLDDIDKKVSSGYVTKEEFEPIKKVVYGLVSLVLTAVVGAVVALVVGAN